MIKNWKKFNESLVIIKEGTEPGLFMGWGQIKEFLGGEDSDWKVIERDFTLKPAAEAGEGAGASATINFEFKNMKVGKYLGIWASLVCPKSTSEKNGGKSGISFRIENDGSEESETKAKEFLTKIQDELATSLKREVSKDLKELGKSTTGSGYQDSVTEEDKETLLSQLDNFKSNKEYKKV